MTEKSALSKKSLENLQVQKRDLLEELHVPEPFASFLRENIKNLQILGICLAVLVAVGSYYNHWSEGRRNEASALLAQAMTEQDEKNRLQKLADIAAQYSRTKAALWSTIELAHAARNAGKYEEAITQYETALDKAGSDKTLTPLLKLNLAAAYEAKGDIDKALGQYQALADMPGFGNEAQLAMGRIYEAKGQAEKAREAYQKLLSSLEKEPGRQKDLVEGKLARLGTKP